MRCILSLSILVSLTACFDPDFNQKPCENQAGCPATFTCALSRCVPAQRCTSQDSTCDNGLVCNVATESCEGRSDMGSTSNDMSMQKPTLTLPSGCTTATVSLNTVWSNIIAPSCTFAGCHAPSGAFPNFGPDMTSFRSSVLGIFARRDTNPGLNYVTASKPDDSFLLYKITGQQTKVPNGLAPMPYNRAMLSSTDQCQVFNWVAGGALP